jgi:glucose-6-phosphate isomerase
MIKFDFDIFKDIKESMELSLEDINTYFLNHKDMMGWYYSNYNQDLIDDINKTSDYIKNNCNVFLVLGIGGSYMGALSVIEALNPYFYNDFNTPKIYFVGTSLSSEHLKDLKELIKDKEIIINVISKSGTTLETTLAYEEIMKLMHQKYSLEELKNRIIITTGSNNKLETDALTNGYKLFNIPNNVGGRFSVFTPVGLLPIAVSGINISNIINGVIDANKDLKDKINYAVVRKQLENRGKLIEAYSVYEPKLYYITEWLKQLYAESLGRDKKGIMPIGILNTRDLHSLGQFIQEGRQILFETNITIKSNEEKLSKINDLAVKSVAKSHKENDVVSNIIELDELNEYNIGFLFQFFMISVAISAFLDNINAFDQNGVEKYKSVLKDLLSD